MHLFDKTSIMIRYLQVTAVGVRFVMRTVSRSAFCCTAVLLLKGTAEAPPLMQNNFLFGPLML